MNELIIIGARGSGREIYNYAIQCKDYNQKWKVKGFLDDKKDLMDPYVGYPPIISSVEDYKIQKNDVFICALGDSFAKKKYVEIILQKHGQFINLIHPTSVIFQNVNIGIGSIIAPFCSISCDITIGSFVTIHPYSILSHDTKVADFCTLHAYTFLGGFVTVKDFVTIGTGAKVLPKISIYGKSVIGAGSIVIKNVPEGVTVFGNPAKILFQK